MRDESFRTWEQRLEPGKEKGSQGIVLTSGHFACSPHFCSISVSATFLSAVQVFLYFCGELSPISNGTKYLTSCFWKG